MRVVIVGHVDHGKSTLVGRLFHDTGQLPEGKLEAIEEMCRRRGTGGSRHPRGHERPRCRCVSRRPGRLCQREFRNHALSSLSI
ncbi:MAG: GTP-binding protein [Alphaproteobacteria bacterium]